MKKYLLYGMQGQKMCFTHVLLNALDLHNAGCEVQIIFEGESVKLPGVFSKEAHPLYQKAVEANLIAGVCKACSDLTGVTQEIQDLGLPLLADMNGHAGMRPYTEQGFEVVVF